MSGGPCAAAVATRSAPCRPPPAGRQPDWRHECCRPAVTDVLLQQVQQRATGFCWYGVGAWCFRGARAPLMSHQEKRLRALGGLDWMAREVEVVLTLLFNLLLLVFLVKLLVAMFSTKLAVILLFAMALSRRFPGGEFL